MLAAPASHSFTRLDVSLGTYSLVPRPRTALVLPVGWIRIYTHARDLFTLRPHYTEKRKHAITNSTLFDRLDSLQTMNGCLLRKSRTQR